MKPLTLPDGSTADERLAVVKKMIRRSLIAPSQVRDLLTGDAAEETRRIRRALKRLTRALSPREVVALESKWFAKVLRYYVTHRELDGAELHAIGHIEYECKELRRLVKQQRLRFEAEFKARGAA